RTLTGLLRCGSCGARMVAVTTTRKKPNRVYQQSWYYCPVSKTKGEVICGHAQRYRKDVIEFRLMERAMEAMKRKPVAAMVAAVNEALKRSAARANTSGTEVTLGAPIRDGHAGLDHYRLAQWVMAADEELVPRIEIATAASPPSTRVTIDAHAAP